MIIEDYEMCKIYGWPNRRVNKIYNSQDKNIEESINIISEIVIHHTEGDGNWQGLKNWYRNPGSKLAQFKKHTGFAHYYVERTGNIYKAFPITRWMHHSCSGVHDKETIGIEVFHKTGPFTEAQYNSLAIVIESLLVECKNIVRVVGHDYNYWKYSKVTKGCPSDYFDWRRFQADLVRREIFLDFKFEV